MLRGRRRRVWYSVLLLAGQQRAAPSSCCTEQINGASKKWSYSGSRAAGEALAALPGVLQAAPLWWRHEWCLKGEEIRGVPRGPCACVSPAGPGGRGRSGAGTGGPTRRRGGESGLVARAGAAREQAEWGSAHARVTSTASARAPGRTRTRGGGSRQYGAQAGGAPASVRRAWRPAVHCTRQLSAISARTPRRKPGHPAGERSHRCSRGERVGGLRTRMLDLGT